MVHLIAPLLLLASTTLALTPTLYSSHSSSSSSSSQITLTAPQSNAVLAHYLGVSEYERMPPHAHSHGKGKKDNDWLNLLEFNKQSSSTLSSIGGEERGKIVVVLEGGTGGDKDLIPSSLSPIACLPSLPTHSYLALLALHLNRLSSSSEEKVWGLDTVLKGLKAVDGWMGWVGDELRGALIKVEGGGKDEMRAQRVEEVRLGGKWVGELDGLDQSAKPLLIELEHLTNLVDSILKQSTFNDNGPPGSSPSSSQNVIIHLKGLSAIPTSSSTYKTARTLLRNTLEAAISSLSTTSGSNEPTILLLSLPPYSPPLLRKRAAWLKPFNPSSRYLKNSITSHSSSSHHKRSSIISIEEGRIVPKALHTPTPIVPSTSICFLSEKDTNNQTANCNGRGYPVVGISTKKGLKEDGCWVCTCENGWGGEGCQKVDLSGDFTLLFFSSFGLIIILFVSVMFLYGVGQVDLPGTLASVNGSGAGGKRD